MRDVLARYWVVAHIVLLAAFLAWVHGGTRVDHLAAVPWLSLLVIEMMLLLPPAKKGETLEMARARVWHALLWDPLLYLGVVLSAYLLFQSLNGGQKLAFDPVSNAWAFTPPPVNWGPFCVEPDEARQMLYWFPPAFAAVLGIRHGTNRRGKLYLLRALAVNGALLALFGVIQYAAGATSLFGLTPMTEPFFASFAYANHAGAFFILLAALSLGLFVHALLSSDERRHAIWLGVALALNLAGALLSLSRAAILFAAVLLVVGGFYAIRHAWRQVDAGVRLRALGGFILLLGAATAFVLYAPAENPVASELRSVNWTKIGSETFGARWLQTSSAWNIWREHPWFGVGGWGYRHYVCLDLDEAKLAQLHRGGANVHNDAMQFLVEHGVVGFALMLGAVAVLLVPVVRRFRLAHTTNIEGWTGEPWLLFRVSPITILLLAGVVLTLLHSLIDLPFRSPAILVTWSIALACAPAFLPAIRNAPGTAPAAGGAPAAESTRR
jgi:O-antigen ligase